MESRLSTAINGDDKGLESKLETKHLKGLCIDLKIIEENTE